MVAADTDLTFSKFSREITLSLCSLHAKVKITSVFPYQPIPKTDVFHRLTVLTCDTAANIGSAPYVHPYVQA
jgi:hypothetical protein